MAEAQEYQLLGQKQEPLFGKLCKLSFFSTAALLVDWSRPLLFNLFVSQNVKASALSLTDATLEMDCVSLSVMSLNILAFATAYGFNGAVDAYAPIAYGAGRTVDLYLILYRQLFMLAILTVILLVVLCNGETLLVAIGQPLDMSRRTGQILFYLCFSVPGDLVYDCLGHWARSQQKQIVVSICAASGLLVNLSVNLLMADPSDPVKGPIFSLVAQNTLIPFFLAFGLWVTGASPFRSVPSFRSVIEDIWPQFRTGIAQMVWTCAELWAWEVQVFEARALGAGAAASYALISSTYSFLIMIPCGVCSAVSSLCGEAIGAGNPQRARNVLVMSSALATTIVACYAAPLVVFREDYAGLVSGGVAPVKTRVAAILPIIAICHFGDAQFNILKSWLSVRNHQGFGAIQSLVVYYCLGLPLGYWLAFKQDWDVAGLWIGLAAAVLIGTSACFVRTSLDLKALFLEG